MVVLTVVVVLLDDNPALVVYLIYTDVHVVLVCVCVCVKLE